MKTITVGSLNPVKVGAVKAAGMRVFPGERISVQGMSVPSGVSLQPQSDKEMYDGALGRADNIRAVCPSCDFCVGIEAGIRQALQGIESYAWVVVKDSAGRAGSARTGGFILPDRFIKLLHQGHELGEAGDMVFGVKNSKQDIGSIGLLTRGILTRKSLYVSAVISAFIPFISLDLYRGQ